MLVFFKDFPLRAKVIMSELKVKNLTLYFYNLSLRI